MWLKNFTKRPKYEVFQPQPTHPSQKREDPTDNAHNLAPTESCRTDSGQAGQPQRPAVGLDDVKRRLAEAAEQDAEAWLDYS